MSKNAKRHHKMTKGCLAKKAEAKAEKHASVSEREQRSRDQKAEAKAKKAEAKAKMERHVKRNREAFDEGFRMAAWEIQLREEGLPGQVIVTEVPKRRNRIRRDAQARLERARRAAQMAIDQVRFAHGEAANFYIKPSKEAKEKLERRTHQLATA